MGGRRFPLFTYPVTLRPRDMLGERNDRQPRFHGPGAGGFHHRHLSLPGRLSPLARPAFAFTFVITNARELRPNPIRSSTSCHGIAGSAGWRPDCAFTIPPRVPAP